MAAVGLESNDSTTPRLPESTGVSVCLCWAVFVMGGGGDRGGKKE